MAFLLLAITATAGNDIANFGRYENDNKRIMELPNTGTRVVFMGNSITDFWPTNRPEFFALNDFIGRGISGQTSYEMIMHFREDVVRLNPAGVVICAGVRVLAVSKGDVIRLPDGIYVVGAGTLTQKIVIKN